MSSAKLSRRRVSEGAVVAGVGHLYHGFVTIRPPADFGAFNDGWPPQLKADFASVRKLADSLCWRAQAGPDQQVAAEALVALGDYLCRSIEKLWHEKRAMVEGVAKKVNFFPLRHTNLVRLAGEWPGDEMRAKLELLPAPMNEKGRRGPKVQNLFTLGPGAMSEGQNPGKAARVLARHGPLLNEKIRDFVHEVIRPGWLVYVTLPGNRAPGGETVEKGSELHETLIIDPKTRERLVRSARANQFRPWANIFAENYICRFCPELLSKDGDRGEFAAMVAQRHAVLQRKNPNEKSLLHAFKVLVHERLEKFLPLIRRLIPPN